MKKYKQRISIAVFILISIALSGPAIGGMLTLSFKDIKHQYKAMTEIQYEKFEASLKGESVIWSGNVRDVEKKIFGDYRLSVDMDNGIDMVSITIPDNHPQLSQIGNLRKGTKIRFEGKITHTFSFGTFIVYLDLVRIF